MFFLLFDSLFVFSTFREVEVIYPSPPSVRCPVPPFRAAQIRCFFDGRGCRLVSVELFHSRHSNAASEHFMVVSLRSPKVSVPRLRILSFLPLDGGILVAFFFFHPESAIPILGRMSFYIVPCAPAPLPSYGVFRDFSSVCGISFF